jgi:sigma-B regulation protein RsbU (phosphoserine phosphatase)
MHQTLREMPGPRAEMAAIVARWDPTVGRVELANCGHVAPLILREDGKAERLRFPSSHGLGGRTPPKPSEASASLSAGDRLLLTSDGVICGGEGRAGLGEEGLAAAALGAGSASAAETVREVHDMVLATTDELADDATVVCLSVG